MHMNQTTNYEDDEFCWNEADSISQPNSAASSPRMMFDNTANIQRRLKTQGNRHRTVNLSNNSTDKKNKRRPTSLSRLGPDEDPNEFEVEMFSD